MFTMIQDDRFGRATQRYLTPAWRINVRVSEWIPKSIVFLGIRTVKNGQDQLKLGGTGFIISVPWSHPTSRDERHLYLITARHSLIEIGQRDHEIRVNAVGGTWMSVPVHHSTKWWFHPEEESVDLAVRPFDISEADVVPVPFDLLLGDDEIREHYVGQGDEVTVTGLFTKVAGESRNMPIVRRGTLAMIPGDRIPIKMREGIQKEAEVYLVEVRSIGGASGSPVFVRAPIGLNYDVHTRSGKFRKAKGHVQGDYFLLGMMHGHWEIRPDQKNADDFRIAFEDEASINLGIAIVVPAKKIRETINHPELVAMRKRIEKESRQEGASTPDHAFEEEPGISRRDFEKALKRVSRKVQKEPPSESDQEKP